MVNSPRSAATRAKKVIWKSRSPSNLEKQIAEFFAQIVGPPLPRFFQRVEGLVSLFEQHWRQRRVSLFAIPRATAGRAQAVHQIDQVSERLGHVESKVPSPGFKVKTKR